MIELLLLFSGLAVVIIFEVIGYFVFVRKYEPKLSLTGRMLLGLALVTLAGGSIGAFGWWFHAPGSFAWDLPPLAGRMLASASWSFALLSLAALLKPTFRRLRLYCWMLGIYMWPLTLAILFLHLDRFDFAQPVTYFFFFIVVVLNLGSLFFLIRQPKILADSPADLKPAPFPLKAWLALTALITGLWSLALFATDSGPVAAIWAWKGDALSSRLIGAMLLTICVGAIYGLSRRDTARIVLGSVTVYGMLLAIASVWNIFADKPVNPAYLLVFGLLGLGSGLLLLGDLALAGRLNQAPTPAG